MAESVREQLITAICTALNGAGGGTVQVIRSLTSALSGHQLPVLVVLPTSEDIARGAHEEDSRSFTARIIAIVADPDTDGGAIDQKADELLVWVEQKVSADPTFGGLGFSAEVTKIDWFMEDSDQDYVGATMTLQVQYYTGRGDPTVAAE